MRPERCRSAGCRSLSLLLGRPVQGPPRSFLPLRCRAPIWVRPPPGAPVCGSPWAEGRAIRQVCARWSRRLSGPHGSRPVSDLESLRAISGFGFAHWPFGGVGLHRAIPAHPGRCASDALSCPSGQGYAWTSTRRRLATTPLPLASSQHERLLQRTCISEMPLVPGVQKGGALPDGARLPGATNVMRC